MESRLCRDSFFILQNILLNNDYIILTKPKFMAESLFYFLVCQADIYLPRNQGRAWQRPAVRHERPSSASGLWPFARVYDVLQTDRF